MYYFTEHIVNTFNPFGLLHRGYNENEQDLKYDKEQDFIFTVQAQAGRYKYKFQGQERQEDLDLGWDSFKYRNYDYAIGRFFNVDPLAEKFPYNGVYNFSENRVVDGVELEGKESMWFGYQGVPQNKIDEANREMARQSGTVLKWLIRTFTPVEDIYGVVTGKYFDGKKYNRAEAATWALIGLIPGGKFFKSFKVVKSLKFSKKVEGLVKISVRLVDDAGKEGKEIITVLKEGNRTMDNAIKVAKDVVGDLGDDAVEHVGKLQGQKGKVVGFKSADGKKGWRIDYDDKKGAHINWWNGKEKGSILFKASENQVNQVINNEIIKSYK